MVWELSLLYRPLVLVPQVRLMIVLRNPPQLPYLSLPECSYKLMLMVLLLAALPRRYRYRLPLPRYMRIGCPALGYTCISSLPVVSALALRLPSTVGSVRSIRSRTLRLLPALDGPEVNRPRTCPRRPQTTTSSYHASLRPHALCYSFRPFITYRRPW